MATGRWKDNGGVAVWEEGVNAPNQIAPPAGFDPNTGQPLAPAAPPPPPASDFPTTYLPPDPAAAPPPAATPPLTGNYGVQGTGGQYHEAGRTYNQVAGWDTAKLNDPKHQTTKYNFMRTVQQLGIPANAPGVLNTVADYMRNHGYPGAKVVSGDKIDFGDGFGPIDVIVGQKTGNGNWGWIHGSQAGAGGGMPPMPSGTGGVSSASAGGVGGGTQPWQMPAGNVSQDPFSQAIAQAYMGLVGAGGVSPFGKSLQDQIMGRIGGTDPNRALKFESAVELANKARRSQLNNARQAMAARNTLSLPGQEQGPLNFAVQSIEEGIAPEFARAIRDIFIDENDRDTELLRLGLQADTGPGNLLGALQGAGGFQQMQAQLALDALSQNQQWNMFLANYGLSKEQLAWEIQNGQMQNTIAMLDLFHKGAATSEGGNQPADGD